MNRPLRIGESGPRREDAALLRGEGRFFAAAAPPGCLHLAILRAPLAHGRIMALDAAPARALPGLALVLTAADLPANGPLPMVGGPPDDCARQPVLADGRVLYAGQPVAAVVAETVAEARAAAAAIRLVIDPLTPLGSAAAALGAAGLHGSDNVVQALTHRAGEPEAAFAAAALVVEGVFRFHRLTANPLEPRGAQAGYDGATGLLRLAATTQLPGPLRDAVARLLGLAPERIEVRPLQLGGGFGCKEAVYPEDILVAAAALRLGRPVRWLETRDEHMTAAAHAREGEARLAMALDAEGVVTALNVEGVSDIGAFFGFAGALPGAAMGGMVRGPYRIPHFAARTRAVTTNKTPLNVYRGAGHPQAVFAMERMMDRAAALTGIDRIALRRRNLIPADGFPHDRSVTYPEAGRIVYDSGDYAACLDAAVEAIGGADLAARRAWLGAEAPALRLGLGLAMLVELTASGPDESVALTAAPDGRVTLQTACVEIGQRTADALTRILSDSLGLPPDRIDIACGGPIARSGGGTFASRGVAVAGSAAADAAAALRAAAIGLAAETLGRDPSDLRWEDGLVLDRAPGRTIALGLADLLRLAGPERADRLAVTGRHTVSRCSFAAACHACLVTVDIETGAVAVTDYAVAHDCGRALDPLGVEDQIIGGVMQGLGATLFESIPYDADVRPLAQGLLDCPLPVAANLPRFHLRHVETLSPLNPLGFKGAGEGGFTGAPAAIASAIEDALSEFGPSLTDDGPYTPARVLELIRSSARDTG